MDEIRRLNLSFNLERGEDFTAYNIIRTKGQKTAYIIQAVLAYENINQEEGELKRIKNALREVIREMNFTADNCNITEESQIPDEVFQIFDCM